MPQDRPRSTKVAAPDRKPGRPPGPIAPAAWDAPEWPAEDEPSDPGSARAAGGHAATVSPPSRGAGASRSSWRCWPSRWSRCPTAGWPFRGLTGYPLPQSCVSRSPVRAQMPGLRVDPVVHPPGGGGLGGVVAVPPARRAHGGRLDLPGPLPAAGPAPARPPADPGPMAARAGHRPDRAADASTGWRMLWPAGWRRYSVGTVLGSDPGAVLAGHPAGDAAGSS